MYDYIIVGGGSAGCAIAARLSEDPTVRVALLEAGKRDHNPLIHIPSGAVALVPTKIDNWRFETVPQPGLKGRVGYQPRGKVLGGSSSINAMVYTRGQHEDYDAWAAAGNPGWSHDDVLPYFKRAEHNERIVDDYHGQGGPLNVAESRNNHPAADAFIEAGVECQQRHNTDFNGADQEGVGRYQVTQVHGMRCSAAKAYLEPIQGRENLEIITRTRVLKVLIEDGRAIGVRMRRGGQDVNLMAAREVILSAGAFQSPQILMLSGIGDGDYLNQFGVNMVHHLPGVGKNLHDHPDYILSYESPRTDLFGVSLKGSLNTAKGLWDYWTKRRGMLTSNFAEAGGFLKTRPDLDRPDIQLHFVVAIVENHARTIPMGHGMSNHVCVLRPKSRGTLGLYDTDPLSMPRIDPNFLSDPDDYDIQTMLNGFKLTRRIMESPALAPWRGKERDTAGVESDAELIDIIRSRADTIYHPVGTCKMGPDRDALSVVDAELRVKGIEGLRVADASIMPEVISGNTNAPSIMIGEKAAHMIKAAWQGKEKQNAA